MRIFKELNMKREKIMGITGVTDEFFCMYLSTISEENFIVVTSTLYEANNLINSLSNYTNNAFLFPMDEFLTSEAVAISPDLKITRLETLKAVAQNQKGIIVTNLMGYLRYLPTLETYKKSVLTLKVNDEIKREDLIQKLTSIGYNRETIVTKTGELGVRGFIIDIFPIDEEHPVRVEFFGDEIDSIRTFDEETQSSLKEIKEISIYPNTEFIPDIVKEHTDGKQKYLKELSNKTVNISEYLPSSTICFKDHTQIMTNYRTLTEEMFEYKTSKDKEFTNNYMFEINEVKTDKVIYYNTLNNIIDNIDKKNIKNFNIKEILSFNENIELINKYLKDNLYLGKTILIYLKDYQIKNFTKHLEVDYIITTETDIKEKMINIIIKNINKGYTYENYIILTDKELFNTKVSNYKYKTNFRYASKIKDLKHLNIGDYVVHNIHGIGQYNGIKTLMQQGLNKDYLELLYEGKDKLYIAVEKIDLISKYSGKEGSAPKINKLGSALWEKTKQRVKAKVKDIAEKLIRLYAIRETKKGFQFSKDGELQQLFEAEFSFTPTPDQLLATKQIKEEMESISPMDRLLCGDVGYGKTEVAFRAIFKAINDGKQVLYLCPTTILSNQQYENARSRFKSFPINIGLLNRFVSEKEAKKIISELSEGKIDILIGTHRLLSSDIKPKNLGLLIIDEEQRFGVTHKEKIKEYKENVDVLTLTATPIPRTLQMSLAGIRSLSLIETPPVNRYPVQTYVIEENEHIIKDSIYKELSRNGQVFILYNSVEKIEHKVRSIEKLVPDAKVVYAHGQLSKTELENRMLAFINHEYDVLICTTIIETGIDIPNVNTLIILDSDHFGLSQLYQIRGRVGRSDRIAYAYLMYNPNKVLTETAVKRLNVIKEFTELGSGFAIATRDLSIRGAGDLLGSEQAGFIDNIGIELYLKILEEEVRHLKGETVEDTKDTKEEKPLLNVETHIKDEYVEDTDLKIEIHKKINEIDSYEKLQEIKKELEDRFGKIDEEILIYMHQEWFEKLAKDVNIKEVRQTKNSIELVFSEEISSKIDGEQLFINAYKISNMFRFQMKHKCLIVILDTIKLEQHYIYLLIELLNKVVLK